MQFLCILRLNPAFTLAENWDNTHAQWVSEHFNMLQHLHAQGHILWVGKTDLDISHPGNIGLVVYDAESLETAEHWIKDDPCIREGIMNYEMLPFKTIMK